MEQTRRILVVEDDQHIADLICLHLRDEKFEVIHSADGDEGMRLLQQGHWDALILDLMLPGVDGLEICRRARAMARYTPIIITSARSSELHRILGLELAPTITWPNRFRCWNWWPGSRPCCAGSMRWRAT